MLNKKSHLIQT